MLGELKDLCTGRVCVVGIGHPLRGDDGAGPAVVDMLQSGPDYLCLDAGPAPENYAEAIARFAPDHVILIDAADFGGVVGEVRLFDATEIGAAGVSSHAPSLKMLARYLEARSACRVHLLAIQPLSLHFGQPLSPPVDNAVRTCASALQVALPYKDKDDYGSGSCTVV